MDFFKKAVKLGSVEAELELARCLRYSLCDDENAASFASNAVRHFNHAADKGSVEARYELGLCHLQVGWLVDPFAYGLWLIGWFMVLVGERPGLITVRVRNYS